MKTSEPLSDVLVEAGSESPATTLRLSRRDPEGLRHYLNRLSGGCVVDIRPSGPVFGELPARRPGARRALVRALSRQSQRALTGLTVVFLATLTVFLAWWASPAHRLSWPGFIANSLLIAIVMALPAYFLYIVNQMRRVNPNVPVPDCRVAMIVTKAPSEPWEMVRTTLEAMLAQEYPGEYDVWLADEDPTEEVVVWCRGKDVKISTRRGHEGYQRLTWPRRRRCKEGNLAYFYDHYGYAAYDVVSQLDADHVPDPHYLEEVVRPFWDPAIGYVAAPSMCDANSEQSWAVVGRPYEEAFFHGALQLGLNADGTPVCIGSHYAVRTQALAQIGGVGPELAEDFTTSYLLNTAGWRGAYAIEAAARGDGPPTFAAMVTQEFQWSRSLTKALMNLVLRTWKRLPAALGLRFVFQSGFNILLSLMFVGGVALFSVASATGSPWVSVNILTFFGLWVTMSGWLLVIAILLRRNNLIRPLGSPIISWQRGLYAGTRLPFILLGVLAAFYEAIVPRTIDFKVTPKGQVGPQPLPVRLILPFLVVAVVLGGSAAVGLDNSDVIGYVGLSLLTALSPVIVAPAVTVLHATEARRNTGLGRLPALRLVGVPLSVSILVGVGVVTVSVLYLFELWSFLAGMGLIG